MLPKRELFLGTMNASKSAQLLMQAHNLERQGKEVATLKPLTDTRDGAFVTSRALPVKRRAVTISNVDDIRSRLHNIQAQVVLVDEIQFLQPKQIVQLTALSEDIGFDIYAYGLLIDYKGNMFNATKKAIECGFNINTIEMQCDFCSSNATNHLLRINGEIVRDGDGIMVGDTEYNSVCYRCFNNLYSN